MQDNGSNLDITQVLRALGNSLRQFGGFSPNEIRRSGLDREATLRWNILKSLESGSLTGFAIIEKLGDSLRPKAAEIYPLLEQMTDEGLITQVLKKDRKHWSLSETGKDLLKTSPEPVELNRDDEQVDWSAPKWVDLRGVVPTAFARLGRVGIEVAKFGTKEQQESAAREIDEARKRIHHILSDDH
ncbi:MAG: PadR family transcriptional regulator [Micrococcales bacterium]